MSDRSAVREAIDERSLVPRGPGPAPLRSEARGGRAALLALGQPTARATPRGGSVGAGATPNVVTGVSALFTFAGLALVALVPPTPWLGVAVTALLVIGYALDAADGQLARLRGGGTPAGEWLDHMVDVTKTCVLHIVVLVSFFRFGELPSRAFLLVPLGYLTVSIVLFFGIMLVEQLRRQTGGPGRSSGDEQRAADPGRPPGRLRRAVPRRSWCSAGDPCSSSRYSLLFARAHPRAERRAREVVARAAEPSTRRPHESERRTSGASRRVLVERRTSVRAQRRAQHDDSLVASLPGGRPHARGPRRGRPRGCARPAGGRRHPGERRLGSTLRLGSTRSPPGRSDGDPWASTRSSPRTSPPVRAVRARACSSTTRCTSSIRDGSPRPSARYFSRLRPSLRHADTIYTTSAVETQRIARVWPETRSRLTRIGLAVPIDFALSPELRPAAVEEDETFRSRRRPAQRPQEPASADRRLLRHPGAREQSSALSSSARPTAATRTSR